MDLSDCLTICLTEAHELVVSEVCLSTKQGEMGHNRLGLGLAKLALLLLEFFLFSLAVARARDTYNVPAPATTGARSISGAMCAPPRSAISASC